MKINGWSFCPAHPVGPYLAPELVVRCAQGYVEGNPGFVDGTFIRTSEVMQYDEEAGVIKTRSGSTYELGEMDPEYKKFQEGQ